jgi:hypothetical protein
MDRMSRPTGSVTTGSDQRSTKLMASRAMVTVAARVRLHGWPRRVEQSASHEFRQSDVMERVGSDTSQDCHLNSSKPTPEGFLIRPAATANVSRYSASASRCLD